MPENSPAQAFAHLRLHTEFSISDGLVTISPLIERLLELKMPAVAVTDIANLFGLIKFYSKSISSGIKPLCGCDVLVRDLETGLQSHLVLLAQDKQGYLNLTELISEIYTDANGLSDAVLLKEKLAGRTAGLIALSGAQLGDVGRALLAGEQADAKSLLEEWQELFPNRFYLELQRLGKPDEEAYIEKVLELAQLTSCPIVATNDVRFLKQDDFEAHEVRVCINERRSLDDPRRVRTYTDQQYLKSQKEMAALFVDIPEALENAWEIAKRCNIELDLGTPCLPNYPTPEGVKLEDYLSQVSEDGLETRLEIILGESIDDPQVRAPYMERLETELKIINQMGFAGYFLIVMEFIQWSKDNGIPVGPGRGSGAGSIVAYALGITDIDPLKYDLLFERFLNPERVSMPDFDVDFCMDGRDRVIAHVAELYGKDAVSQIITFGTMAAKAVVRDVARVQGKPYSLADKLSKLIPFEPGITLKKAFEDEPLLGEFVDSDEDAQEIMEMAYKLEGITRNVGKHAGGVVIAPTKLTDFTPLYCDETGQNLVTQFDKNDVETAGLVKFDFLGLRTLTIIDWAVKMINARKAEGEPLVDINDLPLNDQSVYRLLQKGETTAVFQLESRGMKELIKRQVPNSFEDIIALVALFRPGPLQSGMVDDFIDRKHGRTRVEFPHPELEPVLGNTYGVILYQEQVMKIAQVLANYTLGGADILRKAMGKKDPAVMAKQRTLFVEGAKAREVDAALAESIFDLMEKFAGYGFNKSHSAAYALVSYQTAWLKTHYPAYFMAAVLSADMDNTEKVVTLIEECRSMKLEIVPPDINIGQFNFTVNDAGQIVYGLGAIKGLGEGPVGGILKAREDALFSNLLDVCQRVDSQTINKRTMEALVRSGAMDSLVKGSCDYSRALLSYSLPQAMKAAEQSSRNQASGVGDLFGEIAPDDHASEPELSDTDLFQPWQEQQRLLAEKETLGLYLSGHPIDEFLPELSHLTKTRLSKLRPERGHQIIAGILHAVRTMKSKTGDTIAFLTLDDHSARFEVGLFAREYEKYRELLQKDLILVVECGISTDDFSGGMRGRAKEVMTLAQARKKFANRLALNVEASNLTTGFSDKLAAILSPYQLALQSAQQSNVMPNSVDYIPDEAVPEAIEGCHVVVNYQRNDSRGCIILGSQWKVSPAEDLIQRLKSEFGKDKLEIKYSRPSTLG
jgi:DNA polymerase-3 subunit alpha